MSLQPSYRDLHQNYFFSGSSSPPTNSRQNDNFLIMIPSESSMSSVSYQDRRYSSDIQDSTSPPTDGNLSTSDDEHYGELWNITPTLNISKPEVFPILVHAGKPCQTTPVYQKTLQIETGFNHRENCENLKNEVQRIRCITCSTTATSRWHVDSKGYRICDTCNAICAKGADTSSTIFQQQRSRRKRMCSKRTNVSCSNCEITQTSLWRRNEEGKPICNACGLYYKLHKVNRPMSMKKDVIQVRRRKHKPKWLNEVGDTSTNEDSSSCPTPSPTVSCRFNFPPGIEKTENNDQKTLEPNTNNHLKMYETNFTYNQEAFQPINNFPPVIQRTEINNVKMPEPNANSRLETYENFFAYNREAFQPIDNFPPMIERTEINNEKMPEPNANNRLETYETNFTYNQEAFQPINNNFPPEMQRTEINNMKMPEPNVNSRLETYENIFAYNREAFQPINNFPPMIERTEMDNEKMPEPNPNSRLETYETNFTYNQEAYQPINNNHLGIHEATHSSQSEILLPVSDNPVAEIPGLKHEYGDDILKFLEHIEDTEHFGMPGYVSATNHSEMQQDTNLNIVLINSYNNELNSIWNSEFLEANEQSFLTSTHDYQNIDSLEFGFD